jgi:tetratricopeptide (TPR) repeat protein
MRASLQLIERAKEALEENRLDHAISLLEKALSLAPDNPLADLYLADAWNRKGVPERALGFAQRAQMKLSNRPGWLSLALTQEGLALEGLYRFDVAKGRYKEALRLYPGNARARERLRTLGGL